MFRRRTLPHSKLYNQDTFYKAFLQDMSRAKKQLIIESPFITGKRVHMLLPTFEKLRKRGVQIIINTRNPEEHDDIYQRQAIEAIALFQALDIAVLYTVGHHRKLAIIDNETIWEGSLNILSFNDSCEIMRRIVSPKDAQILVNFIGVQKYLQDK